MVDQHNRRSRDGRAGIGLAFAAWLGVGIGTLGCGPRVPLDIGSPGDSRDDPARGDLALQIEGVAGLAGRLSSIAYSLVGPGGFSRAGHVDVHVSTATARPPCTAWPTPRR
jgi:hypothetical protein